jgi:hypothetical protein
VHSRLADDGEGRVSISKQLHELVREVRGIRRILRDQIHGKPDSAVLIFFERGKAMGQSLKILVGGQAMAKLLEFQSGQQIPNAGPVQITSSDPTIAAVGADGVTLTGIKPGSVQVTGLDATDNVSDSATLEVDAAPPPPPPPITGQLVLTAVPPAASASGSGSSAPAASHARGAQGEVGAAGDVGNR